METAPPTIRAGDRNAILRWLPDVDILSRSFVRAKSEKMRNSGEADCSATGDRERRAAIHDAETLLQQGLEVGPLVADEQPTEFRAEVGEARGQVGVEDVAVEPATGRERCGDLVIGEDGVVGTDLADPAPDLLGLLAGDRYGDGRDPTVDVPEGGAADRGRGEPREGQPGAPRAP